MSLSSLGPILDFSREQPLYESLSTDFASRAQERRDAAKMAASQAQFIQGLELFNSAVALVGPRASGQSLDDYTTMIRDYISLIRSCV